jgi:D-inositol-3-phosphate glycosyltransferase
MSPLKIDVLTNLYPPDVTGGYELLARDVVQGLLARGHKVRVLTTGADTGEPGITRSLRLARPFGQPAGVDRARHLKAAIRNRIATRRYLRGNGVPDVLLVMSLRRLGIEPLRVYRRAGVRAVATVNDDWPAAYCEPRQPVWRLAIDRWLTGFKLLRPDDVDRVMWLSNAVREQMIQAGAPMPPGRIEYQGVDCSLFSPGPHRVVTDRRMKLLFVGRLHPSKGPDIALEALAEVRSRHCDAELEIVGEADDRRYDAELKQQAVRLGLTSYLNWRGKLDRAALCDVYRKADVFLFVSRLAHEGQGLTYLEAMASGVPVVASPSGGAREFLTRYPVARITRACDGLSFAKEILELAGDPAGASRLASEALLVVRRRASLHSYIDAVEQELLAASMPAMSRKPSYTACARVKPFIHFE